MSCHLFQLSQNGDEKHYGDEPGYHFKNDVTQVHVLLVALYIQGVYFNYNKEAETENTCQHPAGPEKPGQPFNEARSLIS